MSRDGARGRAKKFWETSIITGISNLSKRLITKKMSSHNNKYVGAISVSLGIFKQ